ncbi:MAG TPA: epoxyqueuosine reductase QueH [Candidatus Omnitrophota bacterium]|nr:epoxyqueuosine reductase QueH [Candidatus Omnitrophota bacterium]
MKKLLLHTCCAPCTTTVYHWLTENGYAAEGFFYNPNLYPSSEHEMRKKCMEYYCAISGLPMTYVESEDNNAPGNCAGCYEQRLRAAARFAKENGFEMFTTTLLISPYQKHDMIKETGERIAAEEGVAFLYHDFREGYYKSREISAKLNLYRQKYCGCSESLKAREKRNEQVA